MKHNFTQLHGNTRRGWSSCRDHDQCWNLEKSETFQWSFKLLYWQKICVSLRIITELTPSEMLVGRSGENLHWGHPECDLLAMMHVVHAEGHGKRSPRGTGKYTHRESTETQIFLLPVVLFEILLVLTSPMRLSLFWHARILQLVQVKPNHKLVCVNVIKNNCSFETIFFQGILSFANLFTTESCQGHNPLHHLFIPHFTIFLHGILPPTWSAIILHHVKCC